MGMSPVRRAFVILAVAAVVVAIFLVLAQDNFTLKVRSAVGGRGCRPPNLHRGARRRRRDARQRLRRADQRRSGVSRDARGDPRREAADQLRDLHLRQRRDRQSIHRGAGGGRAPRRARQHRRRCGRVQHHGRRARGTPEGRGLPDRELRPDRAGIQPRGSELPHATARSWSSTARSGLPEASGSATIGWATRRTRSTGATRTSGCAARSCACWKRRSTRTSAKRPAK